jgi:hypothetical protein
VTFTHLPGQAPAGHNVIEVIHQAGLRHHRQAGDIRLAQRADIPATFGSDESV